MKGRFLTPLRVQHIDGRFWCLTDKQDYRISDKNGGGISSAPAGFITDFASIPWIARPLIGSPSGPYAPAAVNHDLNYAENAGELDEDYEKRSRRQCDQIFLEGMQVLGVGWWKRSAMYSAVRVGGWKGWGKNRKGYKP